MQLPDFMVFEPFRHLVKKMDAENFGSQVHFDPAIHLTWGERCQLADQGIRLEPGVVRVLNDSTLAYKNSRIVLYSLQPESDGHWYYHIGNCHKVSAWLEPEKLPLPGSSSGYLRKLACTGVNTPAADTNHYAACRHCLQVLNYHGFSGTGSRRQNSLIQIQQSFSLSMFFNKYTVYPVAQEADSDF